METDREELAERLRQAKEIAAAGRIVIANEAAKRGGDAVTVYAGRHLGVLVFQWSRAGIGFGEIALIARDGKLALDNEYMSVDFCVGVIRQALEEAEVVDAVDPGATNPETPSPREKSSSSEVPDVD